MIAEPCVSVCDGACVASCPVDAIHGPIDLSLLAAEGRSERVKGVQLFIDPALCICCGLCEPVCPVKAIFDEGALPERWAHYREKNAAFFTPAGA